ncbi:MAG: DNA-directed RNA polymerase [Methanomassiliicoccales archaeon]|nr:DNA-directed RNA polymerase [Methanomassiliicoccales archaeon]TFG57469.1 MAG: DNA-directed RNA polymerase [Methanomassiliicoccus sp.]
MYLLTQRERVVRIPPDRLGDNVNQVVNELAREAYEGRIEGNNSLTVLIKNIETVGDGRIVHGDGAVYQTVKFDSLIFRPMIQEVVEGNICEILKFGAFVRFGPLDGLLHISQVMDDRIDVDDSNQRLIGKDTKRDLKVGDTVRSRIVALSFNEMNPRESKIGLTMRQPGLGKLEWLTEERAKKEVEK